MTDLVIAITAFLLTHVVPSMPSIRNRLIATLGRSGYLLMYSAASIAVLVWVTTAYRAAPVIPVWHWSPNQNWGPFVLMPLAFMLLVGGMIQANPLSLSLPASWFVNRFDPAHPGICTVVRHPILWAFAVWAAAHMIPNGDVASLMMFGLFLVLALGGALGLDVKRRRSLGVSEWQRLAAASSAWPFQAVLSSRARLEPGPRAVLSAGGGLALYGLVMLGHEWVIGVQPWVWLP